MKNRDSSLEQYDFENQDLKFYSKVGWPSHEPLALDRRLVRKISKRHFFQDIINSCCGVTQMGLEPHQNVFQNFQMSPNPKT